MPTGHSASKHVCVTSSARVIVKLTVIRQRPLRYFYLIGFYALLDSAILHYSSDIQTTSVNQSM